MGKRKKLAADARKAALKTQYFAKLQNYEQVKEALEQVNGHTRKAIIHLNNR